MLEQDSQKNEMEIGDENCHITERWLMKAAEWNPELSSKYRTNRAIGRPRKRWEDDINEFQTKYGSTQQKTAEDGLYSKKVTQ